MENFIKAEVDKLFEGEFCTICKKPFFERKEKDEGVCSGTHPLTYAHRECWKKENKEMKNNDVYSPTSA